MAIAEYFILLVLGSLPFSSQGDRLEWNTHYRVRKKCPRQGEGTQRKQGYIDLITDNLSCGHSKE